MMAIDFSKYSDQQMQELVNQMQGGQTQQVQAPTQTQPAMEISSVETKNPFMTVTSKPVGESAKNKSEELQATQEPLVQSAVNALKVNVAALKNLEANSGMGRIAGIKGTINGMTGSDPNIRPFDSLMDSTAWELAKIANPTGRPTEDAKNDWKRTLGNRWDNVGEASKKIQHGLLLALGRNAAYTPGAKFDPASPENTNMINEILSTNALPEPKPVIDHSNLISPELANQAAAILAQRRKSNGR